MSSYFSKEDHRVGKVGFKGGMELHTFPEVYAVDLLKGGPQFVKSQSLGKNVGA
jgi:hypothetical protein